MLWILSGQKKSILKPLQDLLPFLVFFPSVIFYCARSEVAFPMHPLVTVRNVTFLYFVRDTFCTYVVVNYFIATL